MAARQVLTLAVAVMLVAVVKAHILFGDCTHNNHCDPNSCCRVGFMRYSIPTCSPRGDIGTSCSPAYSEPSSRTLYYPNDIEVVIEEAHFGLCPCRPGLVCTMHTCQKPEPDSTPSIEYNSFDSDYE